MPGTDSSDRLNSWKEIAAWFDVSVRTVQRWEKEEGLPVHRHPHASLSSVFTSKSELERWWAGRPDVALGRTAQPPTFARTSLVVLPFTNLSGDQETEVLSDGLTEELITSLSQVGELRVVARTSSFYFKGKNVDIRTVAKRLGAGAVLEGSVRRSGGRLRISAQLIHAGDGCHLWAQQFDRTMQDLLDIQEETCRAIVDALRLKLVGRQQDQLVSRYGRDTEAYRLYLKGRYFFGKRLPRALLDAIECFEQALVRDPGLAPAYSGLADCHLRLGMFALAAPEEAFHKAKFAALRAVEVDSRLAEAHVSLGFVCVVCDRDWSRAEEEFRSGLQLNPDHANGHNLYAAMLLCQGRLEEGEIELARARDSDPLDVPLHQTNLGFLRLCRRQYGLAREAFSRALEIHPTAPYPLYWLGEACLLDGSFDEAIAIFERVEARAFGTGMKGYCYAKTGRLAEARELFDRLKHGKPCPALQIAVLCLGLGDLSGVFQWLERAVDLRSLGIHWIKVDPIWDPIRADPRFLVALKKMNLGD